jgi:hypothetical protein
MMEISWSERVKNKAALRVSKEEGVILYTKKTEGTINWSVTAYLETAF